MDLSPEQPVEASGEQVASGGRTVKPFPENGFVDRDGRLTDLAHQRLSEFFAAYPIPAKALFAANVSKMYPGICGWVRSMYRAGKLTDTDLGDELDADVRMSVAGGIRRYDPAKGASLATYLIRWVVNGAQRTRDRIERDGRVKTTPVSGRGERDPRAVFEDVAFPDGRAANGESDVEPLGVFQAAFERLAEVDPATAELVRRRVIDGEGLRGMGAVTGASKESVRQKVKRGVGRLAEMVDLRH